MLKKVLIKHVMAMMRVFLLFRKAAFYQQASALNPLLPDLSFAYA